MIYDGLWHLVYHRKSMIYFGLLGFTIFAYTLIKSYDNHVTIEFIRTLLLSLFFLNGLVQGNISTGNLWDSSEFALPIYYILQPLEKNTSLHIFSTSLLHLITLLWLFINITSYYSVVTSKLLLL